jgi:hypothetical protein
MAANPKCTPGLRFYQTMMEKDREARLLNQHRVRELALGREVRVFCSHDVLEFERLAGHAHDAPLRREAPVAAQPYAGGYPAH